ncbi:alpha/beta-hydrolase [Backusella circina FSU 941]|nr:alpha/beta-hydrolase [Backusella circina FSU 941]
MLVTRAVKQSNRFYSTTVRLSFDKYENTSSSKNRPLVICHGLFGSKQNWRGLGKAFSIQSSRDVYTIDARNHGNSPHNEIHDYDSMANDLIAFIKEHNLDDPILMGHSMGGKVIMTTVLKQPQLASKLVVIDMPPAKVQLTREYADWVTAMRDINDRKLTTQKEAYSLLEKVEKDLVVRQFLLTNLKKRKEDGYYQFRIPYDILGRSLHHMGDFRNEPDEVYNGSTLFITGGLSPFRVDFLRNPEIIKQRFPNSVIENIDGAGHWVQTEKPEEFFNLALNFINK